MSVRDNDYDGFIKTFQREMIRTGRVEVENITLTCEGQCPKGCGKKFKMNLGKSITKAKFAKLYNHGKLYPNHCITLKFDGLIKG